jgi:hypothetical protein
MTNLHQWMQLVEAATHFTPTFWYNPQTQQIIPASDHGQAVMDHPEAFGIDYHLQNEMEFSFPKFDPEDEESNEDEYGVERDGWPAELWGSPSGWYKNDAWETLAMNRGWVRIGGQSSLNSAYVSSSTAEAIYSAVKFLIQKYGINMVEIEIARPEHQVFTTVGGDDLSRFIKGGPRRANAFLMARN